MLRPFLCVGLGFLAVGLVCDLFAGEQKSWQQAELEKLHGRWTTVREEKAGADKIRRRRIDLEFTDGKVKVFLFNDKGAPSWGGELKVIGTEEVKGLGLGSIARLKLRGSETQKVEVYYDFVGEKLILVGRVGFRPWEGFRLSGEYKRAAEPK